ncbi:hypothetical protein [Paremcibacter congregatus]|uniref:Permease n=1 Tax=Paremcibacter congregatus TaxID=2043170 RepID=A0A2G4YTF3_9PROT|nr:hypothetical protein [Paremcibacter congregatus]PHZ85605.1 hypothetical protein CRD36_02635 [Paremcibacter congregatus]QDE26564.1 hypothetical protein FIV45_04400 [Paremcibacter congregatus]
MFIGHYAAGFALKAVERKASLGVLFLAVQFVDILYFILVPLGIERLNMVENYTAVNHMELLYYPYSHSLIAAFFWGVIAYGLWRFFPWFKRERRHSVAIVVGLAVLSHWFIDFLVHTADMPLLGDDGVKVGFGLWNNFSLTVMGEISLLLAAVFYYVKRTKPKGKWGGTAVWIFTLLMVGVYLMTVTAPFDPGITPDIASYGGLVLYFLFGAAAFWIDRFRNGA